MTIRTGPGLKTVQTTGSSGITIKKLGNSTPSDLKINADMKQETTRTGRKASMADTLLTEADPLT